MRAVGGARATAPKQCASLSSESFTINSDFGRHCSAAWTIAGMLARFLEGNPSFAPMTAIPAALAARAPPLAVFPLVPDIITIGQRQVESCDAISGYFRVLEPHSA
jgi:hypothetical protein